MLAAMKPRTYRLGRRAKAMAETRRRVVDAARALLLDTGFHEVSIDAIATKAGVGRTTIFQQFHSKAGLLRAVEQDVSARAGVDALLGELAVDDARLALRAAFETGCTVWAAERDLFRTFFRLAAIDREMAKVMADKDAKRRMLVDHLVRRLARQGYLRKGVGRRDAGDVLWLLTSFEAFDTLFEARSSARAVAALLLQLISAFVETGARSRAR